MWFLGWFLGGDLSVSRCCLVVSLWSFGGDSSVSRCFLGGFLMVSCWFFGCCPIALGWGC